MKYKPKHVLEYIQLRTVTGIVRILPLRMALCVGWLIAAASHFIGRVYVDQTRQRVREVLGPDAPEQQIRRIAWMAWRNLMFNGAEALRLPLLTSEKVQKIGLADVEHKLKKILADSEAGFVLATPHMGNWEQAGAALNLMDLPVFVIVRRQKNPLVNAYMNKLRRTFNMDVLMRESNNWKSVSDRLKQGKMLGILPDVKRKQGMEVDFLNGKAKVASGAARFAQLTQCPIYFLFVRRIGWTKHVAEVRGPILPDPTADKGEDQRRLMQEIMTTFSTEILKDPEQYFWHNRRWILDPK